VVVSTQHAPGVTQGKIKKDIIAKVIKPVCGKYLDKKTVVHVNPTGRFIIGGPPGDCGLTGRKIIVDTYGGSGHHGGGCFSGKDCTKVDRSGAYMARYVAKNVVAAGLADRVELQIAYAIGVAEPVSINVNCFETQKVPVSVIELAIRKEFDFAPNAVIKRLKLREPGFVKTASYGHFGRKGVRFTWEATDMAVRLKKYLKKG
jgi:S-adenosylmethionine synthetase